VRPSALILGKDSRKPWSKWDLLIAEAYEIMQRERCGQCGLPRWICHNQEVDHFAVVPDVCFAKREIDSAQEAEKTQRGAKPKLGVTYRPEARTGERKPLSADVDFRERYYRAEYERAQAA
jgi:hypothetical protein